MTRKLKLDFAQEFDPGPKPGRNRAGMAAFHVDGIQPMIPLGDAFAACAAYLRRGGAAADVANKAAAAMLPRAVEYHPVLDPAGQVVALAASREAAAILAAALNGRPAPAPAAAEPVFESRRKVDIRPGGGAIDAPRPRPAQIATVDARLPAEPRGELSMTAYIDGIRDWLVAAGVPRPTLVQAKIGPTRQTVDQVLAVMHLRKAPVREAAGTLAREFGIEAS